MIFFFSGTGNTRWAAERLAQATGDRLVNIADRSAAEERYSLAPSERIGFCFPVHGWNPPKIMRSFVRRLRIDDVANHYCYALCTHGDDAGKAMEVFNADLALCGLHVVSCFSVTMPETYVALPFMLTDTPQREHEKLQMAAERMKEVCVAVVERRSGIFDITEGSAPWLLTHIIGMAFNAAMITDRPFSVDEYKCVGCGVCATACPVDNIVQIGRSGPKWRHDGSCTACLSCYHHCPHHAIAYGPLTKRRGQYFMNKSYSIKGNAENTK